MNKNINFFNTLRRDESKVSYLSNSLELFDKNNESMFRGTLLFENNSNSTEPWIFAQELLNRSSEKIPFIAINPAVNHPFYTAKKIMVLSKIYKRKICINFIIGTVKTDLDAMGDFLDHDERYERLEEYIKIVKLLLVSLRPVRFKGTYYTITDLKLPEIIDDHLMPTFYIAGSSESANNVRKATNSLNLKMAKSIEKWPEEEGLGIYLGIIAKPTYEEAFSVFKEKLGAAYEEGEMLLEFSMKNTDAHWKKELLTENVDKYFRMELFKNFVADCPFLVGSYSDIVAYLNQYIAKGVNTFVIDVDLDDFDDTSKVISEVLHIHDK